MLKFLVAVLFIGVGGTLAWLVMTTDDFCLFCESKSDSSSHARNPLQMALIEDLNMAAKNKELPSVWGDILEVHYVYHSKKTQRSLERNPIVAINKKGSQRLVVEFFDEPGSPDILMVRYNVLDIASGNTVAEMNRRMKLPATVLKK